MPQLVLIDPSPAGRAMLRSVIAGIDWAFVVGECNQYDSALALLADCEADGIILNLDADPAAALHLTGQIKLHFPSKAIIVLSSQANMLVKAHREGASCLLDSPVALDALLLALRTLSSSLQRTTAAAQIITVLGSRGGVGSTSVAVNLGCTLAMEPRNRVALLDLDLTTGSAEVALDVVPDKRLDDVAGTIEQVDLSLFKRLLTRDECGLELLPRPERPQDAALVLDEHIQRILSLLRATATHVVIDLSRGWLDTDLQAMHMAKVILLVVQPDLCSTRNAVHLKRALDEVGLAEKVRLVINRVGANFGGAALSLAKIEEAIGQPIYWQIPNDYRSMMEAWSTGRPLLRTAPKCRAQQSIAGLAKELARLSATVSTNGTR